MKICRRRLAGVIIFAMGASAALADQTAAAVPLAGPAHLDKAKPKTASKPAAAIDARGMQDIKFSDPSAPVAGSAKPSKPALAAAAKALAAAPRGGVSLDLKWRAETHVDNRYWEPWVPNGQGESVEAGVKVGF